MGDRVLIRPDKAEEKTQAGIILVEDAQERPLTGEVIAVGPGDPAGANNLRVAPLLSIGQTVYYSKFGGTGIKLDGEELLILRESDILGKVAL